MDDTVYVNREYGGLVALSAADGAIKWHSPEEGGLQPPAVGDGEIVVPRRDSVVAYDETGSDVWTIGITVPDTGMGGYMMGTEVALAHGQCYVGIADGRVYAIGSRD